MNRKHLPLSILAALVLFAPAALADQVSFSFHGGSITTFGTLTMSETSAPGFYDITGISGTFTDNSVGISGAITGLYQPVSYTAPPAGTPVFTTSGISYDDTFYPAGNSPHNCADYPFFGGLFDVYGVAFDIAGGFVGALWSDGNIPGVGQVYAAGDSNATTLLDLPNPTGSDQSAPVGVPGQLTVSPEPGSLMLFGIGLAGVFALRRSRGKKATRA